MNHRTPELVYERHPQAENTGAISRSPGADYVGVVGAWPVSKDAVALVPGIVLKPGNLPTRQLFLQAVDTVKSRARQTSAPEKPEV